MSCPCPSCNNDWGDECLYKQISTLLDACDDALNTLIGSCLPGPGVDDKSDILRSQANLRRVLKAKGSA